jgi:predicted enzyme related to lactoylglutathione lyase
MNAVVHFELPYDNAERAAAFYRTAFGWQTQQFGGDMGNYVVVTTATGDVRPDAPRGAINGGLYQKKPDFPAQYPSIVIGVEDLEHAMRKVREAGGEVLGEPVEIPGIGRYVSFFDTERNRNSLLQPNRAGTP